MSLGRQFATFVVVGLGAFVAHYGVLIWLVEAWGWPPVPATLVGYVAGGVVSYALNRRHTYVSDRPHAEAGWRFALVAGVGFVLTTASMYAMTHWFKLYYLIAQVMTTGLVLCWSFVAHRVWTFAEKR